MDLIIGLFKSVATAGILFVVIFLVAMIMPIVFSLATSIDKRINNQ